VVEEQVEITLEMEYLEDLGEVLDIITVEQVVMYLLLPHHKVMTVEMVNQLQRHLDMAKAAVVELAELVVIHNHQDQVRQERVELEQQVQ
tara:strand:- start:231 stop:500 length:270 start_codon:yes stop_codon:yes gene_type:complete